MVSIISVNFNQTEVTGDFLDSVRKLRYSNCEMILVDNGSTESPGPWLQANYPEVRYLESTRNLGFSGGNNLGITEARGDYFFFVNNDTILPEDVIDKLVAAATANPQAGVICPMLLYYDRPDVIQYAGYTEMNQVTARNETIGQFDVDKGQYTEIKETAFAHGAAMFVPREVVEKVGMMPELFFLYYEELDWSAKIKEAGYSILLEPAAKVIHKESVSVGKTSPLKTYYMNRNRVLFMRRHSSFPFFLVFVLYWLFVVSPKQILTYLVKMQWTHLRAFLSSLFWHLRNKSRDPDNAPKLKGRPLPQSETRLKNNKGSDQRLSA